MMPCATNGQPEPSGPECEHRVDGHVVPANHGFKQCASFAIKRGLSHIFKEKEAVPRTKTIFIP